jgi:hypothetical protein
MVDVTLLPEPLAEELIHLQFITTHAKMEFSVCQFLVLNRQFLASVRHNA